MHSIYYIYANILHVPCNIPTYIRILYILFMISFAKWRSYI